MLKVMTIVGTRPELIKMSRVVEEFDKYTNHILVHTGQNYDYELNQIFFEDLGIRSPDYFLGVEGNSACETIGQIIIKADEVISTEKPDAIMLYGDTNSCLAVIPAKRRKVPVFHLEAGNRCFDERVPEELNRKILDHLSDINLVLTEHSRRYLVSEGIKPETIIKTGSNMREVLDHQKRKIEASTILGQLALDPRQYFVVSMHREENVDSNSNLIKLLETLNGIASKYDLPVVVSTHPRTRKRMNDLDGLDPDPRIRFLKPFGFSDYIKLQMNCLCVISDSGTITEEASLLNLPSITIRNTHERPEGMDAGTLIMSGLLKTDVLSAIDVVISHHGFSDRTFPPVHDYDNPVASKQILRLVLSYTGYIRRNVWRERE